MLKTTSGSPAGPVMSTTRDNCIGRITRCLITGLSVCHRPTIIKRIEHLGAADPPFGKTDANRLCGRCEFRRNPGDRSGSTRQVGEAGFRVIRTAA